VSLATPENIRRFQRRLYVKAKEDGALPWPSSVCLDVKPVGEPDAGEPHVRFDERGRETESRCGLRHRQMAKAAGNSYSPRLRPPRSSSTLPLSRAPAQLVCWSADDLSR